MTRLRSPVLALGCVSLFATSGCSYFATHEGSEEGVPAWRDRGDVAGLASFAVVGIAPETAQAGDSATVFMASETDSPTDQFTVDDFWFCTFDGQSAMLETGGTDYEGSVDNETVAAVPDLGLTTEDLDGSIISTVTFTVPDGSVTGDGIIFLPDGSDQGFFLGIGSN